MNRILTNDELEQRIEELEETIRDNDRKLTFKGEQYEGLENSVLGFIHAINSPLMVIRGYRGIATNYAKDLKLIGCLDQIERGSDRIAKIVKCLYKLVESKVYDFTIIDPKNIITNSYPLDIPKDKISVTEELQEGLWQIKADGRHLKHTMENIIDNAVHAMEKGGELNIKAENTELCEDKKIVVYGKKDYSYKVFAGKYVKISVTDNGIGIKKEYKKYIFEPFSTSKKKGKGIGLSFAMNVIRDHGGFIEVESELGKGTTFDIYIPAVKPTPK